MTDGRPKKLNQRKGDRRRDALVQAAAGLFWAQGYNATSLADVASAADVPLGNLYYYYKTKADLARGVAELFVEQTQMLIDTVSSDEHDPRKRLKLIVTRLREAQGERVRLGCPIASACRDFRSAAPDAAQLAGTTFAALIGFLAQELGRTGQRPSIAMNKSRQAIADWQGGIALAHALEQPGILSETYVRMERKLLG